MDKSEQKEMKKINTIKNTWHDWLINYTPQPNIKLFKDRIVNKVV